jgi:predicted HTH domain antitoxin
MKTLTINIPDNVDINVGEARLLLAAKLYEKGKLTLGQAAEIVGLSKRSFMEILADFDVSPINSAFADIEKDVTNARNYSI